MALSYQPQHCVVLTVVNGTQNQNDDLCHACLQKMFATHVGIIYCLIENLSRDNMI